MSERAIRSHNDMVQQLKAIYFADGRDNPFLAAAINTMARVSYVSALCQPETALSRPERGKEG
jgi:hypothetical protein